MADPVRAVEHRDRAPHSIPEPITVVGAIQTLALLLSAVTGLRRS